MSDPQLTDAQAWMLDQCSDRWLRPMDMGARDGTNHSALLAALVRKGLVERKQRGWATGAYARGSYLYRITPEGAAGDDREFSSAEIPLPATVLFIPYR